MSQAITGYSIMKQEFINNLSHEVRTPMHHIGSGIEALHKDWDKYSPEQLKEFAQITYQGYQNATKYIENLLDFSNLSTNKVSLKLSQKNFSHIVEEIIAEFKELYLDDPKIKIELHPHADSLQVNCDQEKIKKVITSLLENALQYGEKGLIEIFVSKSNLSDGSLVAKFAVCDSGVGIPANELVHIFGPFVQSSATKKMSGGKGIGLALSEQIIKMHQGKIWAENNFGKPGATFFFVIPLSTDHS